MTGTLAQPAAFGKTTNTNLHATMPVWSAAALLPLSPRKPTPGSHDKQHEVSL